MQNLKEHRKFLRQCVCCREYKIKPELIKITKDFKTGEININNTSKIFGRSVYICKKESCIKNAIKKKKIEYALKTNLTECLKEKLEAAIINENI